MSRWTDASLTTLARYRVSFRPVQGVLFSSLTAHRSCLCVVERQEGRDEEGLAGRPEAIRLRGRRVEGGRHWGDAETVPFSSCDWTATQGCFLFQILNAAYHVEVTFHSGSSVTRMLWEQIKQVETVSA